MIQKLFRFFLPLLLVVFFATAFLNKSFAQTISLPAPTGFVNDFANVLSSGQKQALESQLQSYEQQTTNEISVVTVKSLHGDTIDDYTVRLFEQWKIGKKAKDNGILFLASIDERKIHIEVGYGLEPYLTDSDAGNIIRNIIAPQFQKGDYYTGISSGLNAIESHLNNPSQQPIRSLNQSFTGITLLGAIFHNAGFSILILLFFFHILVYFFSFMSRSKNIALGGIAGGIIGILFGLIAQSVLLAAIFIVVFGGIGLLLDFELSRNYDKLKKVGKHTGFSNWWSTGGGFWTGGESSGGGFGGFGGGSSGGGGASGGW